MSPLVNSGSLLFSLLVSIMSNQKKLIRICIDVIGQGHFISGETHKQRRGLAKTRNSFWIEYNVQIRLAK